MSDTDAGAAAGNVNEQELPQFRILAQYVKDLSFENPNAPESFRTGEDVPKTDVGIDVQARRRDEPDHFEAEIKLTISSKRGDTTLFIVELEYGGIFLIKNVVEESLQPVLLIECPRMLFPFARRIIADTVRDGGFPPMMLDPIDFAALYRAQLERAQQQAAQEAEGQPKN